MKLQCCIFVLAGLCYLTLGAHLPSDFKLCKRGEVSKGDCFKAAIQNALPKVKNGIAGLKVPSVDPLLIESATIGDGKGAVNVVQNYKNLKVFGISNSTYDSADLQLDLKKRTFTIHVKSHTTYRLEADYKLDGQVLLLPVVGEGPCTVLLRNVATDLLCSGELFENKGKEYLKVTDAKQTLDPELVTYNFENLFNGDKVLGDQINNLLNDNWKEIFSESKEGFEQITGTALINILNNVITKVPFDELFPK